MQLFLFNAQYSNQYQFMQLINANKIAEHETNKTNKDQRVTGSCWYVSVSHLCRHSSHCQYKIVAYSCFHGAMWYAASISFSFIYSYLLSFRASLDINNIVYGNGIPTQGPSAFVNSPRKLPFVSGIKTWSNAADQWTSMPTDWVNSCQQNHAVETTPLLCTHS